MSSVKPSPVPVSDSTETFRSDLLKGKIVFCTGGRSGICYTITETLMRHGADAVIIGRDAKGLEESAGKLSKATGRRCIAASGDVRKPADLEQAVSKTRTELGRIDFVICGAAGNFLSPIDGLSPNGFKTVIDIDLLGTYNTIKATLPLVRESRGAYLHISATLHYRGTPWQAHVSAAKAGVDALSQALAVEEGPRGVRTRAWLKASTPAVEEGPRGVRSNVIAPGPIAGTEGMDRLAKGTVVSQIPLSRMGDKRDIANAALFLFSPAASWVTGQILAVDGGEHHMRTSQIPYPQAVLDPKSVMEAGESKAKL